MIIQGDNGLVIDTDKLSETESEIADAAIKLHQLCEKYKKPMFCIVSNNKKPIMYWNLKKKEEQLFEETSGVFDNICRGIQYFVQMHSNGNLGLSIVNKENDN